MNGDTYRLTISGDAKTVRAIIKRLSDAHRGFTVKNFLVMQGKPQEVLV